LEEAALRNVAFRVAYNLDRGTYKVEVGDPSSLIFKDPEKAEEHRQNVKDKMKKYTKRQIEEGVTDLSEDQPQFQALDDEVFTTAQQLPEGLGFAFIYTPQYGEEGLRPNDEMPEEGEEERIAYSHVFPDGSAEHTVIRIIELDDEDEGYSLEIEPVSGKVKISNELIEPQESMAWVPEEAPTIR